MGPTTTVRATYDLLSARYDEDKRTAVFFATYSPDRGPVPPTHKTTQTDYVYVLVMNGEGLIKHMAKVWSAP